MNFLVFHHLEDIGQTRGNISDYLFCFERYGGRHNYIYHQITLPITEAIRNFPFDVIIFDSTSLGVVTLRPRSAFYELKDRLSFLSHRSAVKLVFPQDDYNHSDVLDQWFCDLKCDAVFTPLLDYRHLFYPRSSRQADFFGVLTGYVDDWRIEPHRRSAKPFAQRSRSIVQRVTSYPAWGGRFSRIKGETAEMVKRAALARKLEGIDISTDAKDVLLGDAWFQFLGDAKFCLGAPSGVSLWDRDGQILDRTESYLSSHPGGGFKEVEAACFRGLDCQYTFSAVSPRLFEAAQVRCSQILVEGEYVPEIKPYEHYLPLAADGSNLDEIFESIKDEPAAERRAAATYEALIENPKYRYSRLVEHVMQYLSTKLDGQRKGAIADTDFDDVRRAHRRQLLRALNERERSVGLNGNAVVGRVASLFSGQLAEPHSRPDAGPPLIGQLAQDLSAAHEDLAAAHDLNGVLADQADALRREHSVVCDQNRALREQNRTLCEQDQALNTKLAELNERLAGAIECPGLPAQRDLIERYVRLAERRGHRPTGLPFHLKIVFALLCGVEEWAYRFGAAGVGSLFASASFHGALLGGRMHKWITLAWCVIVAFAAYPLGSLATGQLGFWVTEYLGSWMTTELGAMPGAVMPAAPGVAISFALALLAGLCVLPRRLSPLAADGLAAIVASTTAWVLAGASIWATYRYFIGNPKPDDAWALRSTAAVQALLALAGFLLIQLLNVRRAPLLATIACLPLFLVAFPTTAGADAAGAAGYLATGLFLLVNLATYRVLMARYRFDGYSLALYSLAVLQWIVAALVGWILVLSVAGVADRVPTWLPIATALLQACLTIGLPIGLLAASGRISLARLFYNQAAAEEAAAATTVIRSTADGKRTAWILSYTGVSNEPRVRRQADALINSGWHVVVCGFDGHSPRPEQWSYIRLPDSDKFTPRTNQLLRFLRGAGTFAAVYAKPKAVATAGALLLHWCTPNWLHIKICLLQIARQEADLKPDLVIANDYYTCDVAYAICCISGAKLVVDCHEYAVEQSSHDPHWVKWSQPLVRAVEAHYLARADLITTVCDGIADLLNADHRLRRPALVIRSVPISRPQPFRPTGERIKVLYHGNIWHVRQLHTAIESMRLWRPEFDLVLRGDSDPAYLAELRRMVVRYGLECRVFFEAPVPFEQIIPEANKADIGYFSYDNFSPQSEFVLPNKFFEYVMAGLALCVVDFAEMGRLTRRYGFGKLIPEHSPKAIAETINSFTREEIDRLKKASVEATKDLNWDREKERLLTAYNDLFSLGATARPAPKIGSTPAIEAVT